VYSVEQIVLIWQWISSSY